MERTTQRAKRIRKLATLIAVSIATFMVPLDITVVAVALPDIQRSLNASFADIQWVVNAYTLTFGAFLLTGGSLADLFGRRRIFVIGLYLFTFSSLLCGFAPNPLVLNLARGTQGIGAAFLFSAALALLAEEFHGRTRATVFSIWAAVLGMGIALGPLIGGGVTGRLGWKWDFLINVPIGAIVIALTLGAKIRESCDPDARGVDWAGLATFASGFFMVILALVSGNERGWGSPLIVGLLIGGILLFAGFVVAEGLQQHPMFDLALFRKPTFSGASIIAIAIAGSFFSMFIYLPLYFQIILSYSPLKAGLSLLPLTVPLLIVPPIAAKLSTRMPARILLSAGLGLVCLGLLWSMTGINTNANWTPLLAGFVVAGTGAGLVNGELPTVAISVVPPERSGMASGIASTCRQIGFGIGIAGLGAILTWRTEAKLLELIAGTSAASSGRSAELAKMVATGNVESAVASLSPSAQSAFAQAANASFTSGLRLIMLVAAAVAIVGAVLAFVLVRERDIAQTPITPKYPQKLALICPR